LLMRFYSRRERQAPTSPACVQRALAARVRLESIPTSHDGPPQSETPTLVRCPHAFCGVASPLDAGSSLNGLATADRLRSPCSNDCGRAAECRCGGSCALPFCEPCFAEVHRLPALRNHPRTVLAEASVADDGLPATPRGVSSACLRHPEQTLSGACVNPDCLVLLCKLCSTEAHMSHPADVIALDAAAARLRGDLAAASAALSPAMQKWQHLLAKLAHRAAEADREASAAVQQVSAAFLTLLEALEAERVTLLRRILGAKSSIQAQAAGAAAILARGHELVAAAAAAQAELPADASHAIEDTNRSLQLRRLIHELHRTLATTRTDCDNGAVMAFSFDSRSAAERVASLACLTLPLPAKLGEAPRPSASLMRIAHRGRVSQHRHLRHHRRAAASASRSRNAIFDSFSQQAWPVRSARQRGVRQRAPRRRWRWHKCNAHSSSCLASPEWRL
jgi:hypothetical protein